MEILSRLITDKTPILELSTTNIPYEKLEEVFRCDERYEPSKYENYLEMIHEKNGLWYYFKTDGNSAYPYATMDELLGSYISKSRNLLTVCYEIALRDEFTYGLASINFKKDTHEYYYIRSLPDSDCYAYRQTMENINALRLLCKNKENEELFIKHLLNLFALDIYMLQKDRCSCNLFFQIEKESNFFDLGPIHDYSNCINQVGREGLFLRNAVNDIGIYTLKMLFRNFPEFSDIFKEIFAIDMTSYVDKICDDFNFNKDCYLYENMMNYYKVKQEKQRQYFKKFLK